MLNSYQFTIFVNCLHSCLSFRSLVTAMLEFFIIYQLFDDYMGFNYFLPLCEFNFYFIFYYIFYIEVLSSQSYLPLEFAYVLLLRLFPYMCVHNFTQTVHTTIIKMCAFFSNLLFLLNILF